MTAQKGCVFRVDQHLIPCRERTCCSWASLCPSCICYTSVRIEPASSHWCAMGKTPFSVWKGLFASSTNVDCKLITMSQACHRKRWVSTAPPSETRT